MFNIFPRLLCNNFFYLQFEIKFIVFISFNEIIQNNYSHMVHNKINHDLIQLYTNIKFYTKF